jgi:putative DNA primase/helicase
MIPASIVNDLVKLKKLLIDNCFQISAEKNAWTKVQEILNEGTDKRMQLVESPGFHGGVFLLPNNEIIGEIPDGGCPPILDPTSKVPKHSVERQGTLQEWQSKVAMSALNSSRIMLALATTFSASLLHLTNAENGGIHVFGISSTGKTTCLYVAISVQGSQSSAEGYQNYIYSNLWQG